MKVTFKNEYYIECDSCSYIGGEKPFLQIQLNTNDYTALSKTLRLADYSMIKLDNGSIYTGFYKSEISVIPREDMTLDVVINIVRPDLADRVGLIEKMNTVDTEAMTLDEYKDYKQNLNNLALAEFLSVAIVDFDGKKYGVQYEDQTEMAMNYIQYVMFKEKLGITKQLEWHPKKGECDPFTEENYLKLLATVTTFVYPYVKKCQSIKSKIYSYDTKEAISEIEIDYSILEDEYRDISDIIK